MKDEIRGFGWYNRRAFVVVVIISSIDRINVKRVYAKH